MNTQTTAPFDIFMLAGEHSGDQHGADVLSSLYSQNPHLRIEAIAGPKMRQRGVKSYLNMEEFGMIGLASVLWNLPKLINQYRKVHRHILKTHPKSIVLIDYPGFNLRLAQKLRKEGYGGKIIYFISPKVWAWGQGRIKKMEKSLDLLLCIFPFEKDLFASTQLPVKYVGNPSVEQFSRHHYDSSWKEEVGLESHQHIVGVFPGSRQSEIKQNLPPILCAAESFKKKHPECSFVLSVADSKMGALILQLSKATSLRLNKDLFFTQRKDTEHLMHACHTAIATSGTVTLELALHAKPTIVVYHVTGLNYFLAKYLMRVNLPYYCIVNILMKREVFPELIHRAFNSQNLCDHLERIYCQGHVRQTCLKDCQSLSKYLGSSSCSEQTAHEILSQLL